ncbi:hypothetical protein NW759_016467 [Fusarium solani]|nr:hypothetical protein NW759_016467 [Fusarium solani]
MVDGAVHVSITVFATLAVATLAFVLRLAARRTTKMDLKYDDILAIVAFTLGSLTDDNAVRDILAKSRLSLFLTELLYAFSLTFSKLAILAFYWRMFKTSNIRIPILVLAGLAIIWLAVRIFLTIFHCMPIQSFWDKTIESAKCTIDESNFFFGTVLAHFLIDVVLLILPVIPVRRLHLAPNRKAVVIVLFAFGIL